MQREGSALHGLGVVILKELTRPPHQRAHDRAGIAGRADRGRRALWRDRADQGTTAEDPFLFLRLFTTARDAAAVVRAFLSFLVPLIAIGLGFDAVNGEHNRRTLSRILSQPIYRDALLFGKFLAGLFTLAISLIVLWLLVIGLGLFGSAFRRAPRRWRGRSSS